MKNYQKNVNHLSKDSEFISKTFSFVFQLENK
jgi:hypothetical protein